MQKQQQLQNLVAEFLANAEQTSVLWQLAVLATSLALAWGFAYFFRNRVRKPSDGWRVGIGSLHRLVFPLTALLLVWVAQIMLGRVQEVGLLKIAVPLLLSFAVIRVAIYLLRHAFGASGILRYWERILAITIWIGVALYISGVLPLITLAMDDIGISLGAQRLTLLVLVQGLFSIVVTVLVALWLGTLFETRVMGAEGLEMNLRVLLAKFVRAALLVVAVLIALPAVGIDVTVLSVFGGALGVGLGFGLQKIASNYVSGFIILADKSIHIGDLLTVADRYGTVTRLTGRYLVLRSMDGTESIIPNEALITSTVINHSYTDRKIRLGLPVQVSYGSPVETAMQIMLEAAKRQPRVITDPEPRVFLREFADSGINLELAVWIADPEEGQAGLKSDINLDIWREFKRQGIEIPFPQRDVRIVSQAAAPAIEP